MEQMKNAIETIFNPKGFAFVRKNLVRWNHSYIKYALDFQHFYEAFVKNAIKCKKSGKKRESNHLD